MTFIQQLEMIHSFGKDVGSSVDSRSESLAHIAHTVWTKIQSKIEFGKLSVLWEKSPTHAISGL